MLGLWHTTQYSTRLRRLPCTLKPCEKTPWHEAHFAWSTTVAARDDRRAVDAEVAHHVLHRLLDGPLARRS